MEQEHAEAGRERLLAVALAAVAFAIFAAGILLRHRLSGQRTTLGEAAAWALASCAAWLALVPLVVRAEARIHERARGPARWLAAHLAAGTLAVLAYALLRTALDVALPGLARPDPSRGLLAANLLRATPIGLLVYAALAAGAAALRHRAEARRFATGATPMVAPTGAPAAPPAAPSYVARLGTRETVVAAAEIRWAEAAGNYVALHTPTGRHLVRATLGQVMDDLEPFGGLRVHRGALVRRDAVRALHAPPDGPAAVELADGTRVEVSRRHLPAVRAALRG